MGFRDLITSGREQRYDPQGFIAKTEFLSARGFLTVVKEKYHDIAALFYARKDDKINLPELIGDIHDPERQKIAIRMLDMLSKYADSRKEGRKHAAVEVSERIKDLESDNPDDLRYTIRKFREKGLSPEQVQKLVDENALMEISLTGHPVNARSEAMITKLMELKRLMEDPATTKEQFTEKFREMLDMEKVPYTGVPKTAGSMTEEALSVIACIREAEARVKAQLEAALEEFGYDKVKVTKPLIKVAIWQGGGDADGNPNADEKALAYGISKVKGTGTTIDLRHNSSEFSLTVARLAEAAGLFDELSLGSKGFDSLTLDAQAFHLTEWLKDPEVVQKLKAVTPEQLVHGENDEAGEAAARLFRRMKLIAENPEASDKLIIAETGHAAHALGAMLTLKAAGCKVAEKGAGMNIVTLTESVDELQKLPEMMKGLLKNKSYREHVKAMGNKVTIMIAKSDTVRQDGMSAVSYQAEAIGRTMYEMHKMGIKVQWFMGGGGDLTRGGMRLSKNPHMVAVAIAQEVMLAYRKEHGRIPSDNELFEIVGDMDIGPTIATVQGPDMQGKFSGPDVAVHTASTTISQNMLAAAQVKSWVDSKELYGNELERIDILTAVDARKKGAAKAREMYGKYLENGSVDGVFQKYSTQFTNKTATQCLGIRPAKRGEKLAEAFMTVKQIVGDMTQFIKKKRAIVVAKECRHAGHQATSIMGQSHMFATIDREGKAKELFGEDNLHHTYKWDPIFSDHVRREIELMRMTDFEHTWRLAGEERPGDAERAALAAKYDINSKSNPPDVTLAHLEEEALVLTQYAYWARQQEPPEKFYDRCGRVFGLHDALAVTNPLLDDVMKRSAREGEVARYLEEQINPWALANPDMVVDNILFRLCQYIYASADVGDERDMVSRQELRLQGARYTAGSPEVDGSLKIHPGLSGFERGQSPALH